jgi:hypothetical protein
MWYMRRITVFEAYRENRRPVRETISLGLFRTLEEARKAIDDDYEARFGPIDDNDARFKRNRIWFDYSIIFWGDNGKFERHPPQEKP